MASELALSFKDDIQRLIWRIDTYRLSVEEIESLVDKLSIKYRDLSPETVRHLKQELAPFFTRLEQCTENACGRSDSGVIFF